jgi:hypothetical protein
MMTWALYIMIYQFIALQAARYLYRHREWKLPHLNEFRTTVYTWEKSAWIAFVLGQAWPAGILRTLAGLGVKSVHWYITAEKLALRKPPVIDIEKAEADLARAGLELAAAQSPGDGQEKHIPPPDVTGTFSTPPRTFGYTDDEWEAVFCPTFPHRSFGRMRSLHGIPPPDVTGTFSTPPRQTGDRDDG